MPCLPVMITPVSPTPTIVEPSMASSLIPGFSEVERLLADLRPVPAIRARHHEAVLTNSEIGVADPGEPVHATFRCTLLDRPRVTIEARPPTSPPMATKPLISVDTISEPTGIRIAKLSRSGRHRSPAHRARFRRPRICCPKPQWYLAHMSRSIVVLLPHPLRFRS